MSVRVGGEGEWKKGEAAEAAGLIISALFASLDLLGGGLFFFYTFISLREESRTFPCHLFFFF